MVNILRPRQNGPNQQLSILKRSLANDPFITQSFGLLYDSHFNTPFWIVQSIKYCLVFFIFVMIDMYHDFALGFQSTLPPNDICPPSVTPGKMILPYYSL